MSMLDNLWQLTMSSDEAAALAQRRHAGVDEGDDSNDDARLWSVLGPLLAGAKSAAQQLQEVECAAAKQELAALQMRLNAKLERTRRASKCELKNQAVVQEAEYERQLQSTLASREEAVQLADAEGRCATWPRVVGCLGAWNQSDRERGGYRDIRGRRTERVSCIVLLLRTSSLRASPSCCSPPLPVWSSCCAQGDFTTSRGQSAEYEAEDAGRRSRTHRKAPLASHSGQRPAVFKPLLTVRWPYAG